MFVTSTSYNGDIGGVNAANTICQERANVAGLPGTYLAWLSNFFEDSAPVNRFRKSGKPYQLVDGTRIADDWTDLITLKWTPTATFLAHPVNLDEYGADVGSTTVWTNTDVYGTRVHEDWECSNWTSAADPDPNPVLDEGTGYVGSTTEIEYGWTGYGQKLCNGTKGLSRLYCFQQE